MAFCGQCGLLLTTNTTTCPRCGAATDFQASTTGTPEEDVSTTIITHKDTPRTGSSPYTPSPPSLPSDTMKAPYYPAPGAHAYPEQSAPQPSLPPNTTYPTPGALQSGFLAGGNTYPTPDAPPQQNYQAPGVFPATNPSYPFQAPTPPRKTRKWPFILIIVLIIALAAVSVLLFTGIPKPLAALFGTKGTPNAQITPTTRLATTTVAPSQPSPTSSQLSPTPTTTPTQQAQATVQLYYTDINNHDYQAAYDLWVTYPDTYNNFKQGFAHTQHDDITIGTTTPQVDGTVQVNVTLQATNDASGGGTQVSTYQGYYTVGQQQDGSWKIITAQLS